jgi:2-desacetyl-2-hydroxyethyl bacteriochlorophyllide A dehydrogenase
VLGTFHTACGQCFFCRKGNFIKCDNSRVFGHGAGLGNLPGTQAEQVLVPHANLTLRRVPEGLSNDAALFAGDVMGTGYHAIVSAGLVPGDTCAVIGLGPVGLCTLMTARVAGASRVFAIDMVPERLEMARKLGGEPVHLTEEDPRAAVREATEGRGVDVAVEAVGNEKALDLAIRLARKSGTLSVVGVYAERAQVHMGLVWIKNLTVVGGQANVMGHLDSVLPLMAAGRLDPTPLVTHHMKLADAQEAYDAYASHQALKIVLSV